MLRDAENRRFSIRKRSVAVLLLWALLSAVFPVSIFSASQERSPDGAVYCPLAKKLQPREAAEKKKATEPFDALCASPKTKDRLFQELVLKNPWRIFTLDAKGFDNLVFDYLAGGKAALEKLPAAPGAPLERSVKQAASTVAVGSRGEQKLVWKRFAACFLPTLAARPPTASESFFPPPHSIYRSAALSRRIAPRAPPLFS
ncbi:MAG TPA: hypothetical protein VIL74_04735 [Pyrinomonadaceae bacterium]